MLVDPSVLRRQRGTAVFIETFDPDLSAFRIDIASQAGASFDLGEALS